MDFLKRRWPLFLVLVVFIICKAPHLFYPYYWDESWSYLPALIAMFHHGMSLMPAAMDPIVSRGHPLLYHNLSTLWMDIFGTSHFSMHSFALFISVFLIIAVYEAGRQLFNPRVAAIGMLLVVTQEAFFVQSAFLLPEVLVALFCFLGLWFYVKDKYILTAIFLTALFYTKESGMVLGVVLGIDAFIRLFNKDNSLKDRLYRLSSIAAPCVLIAVFFLVQKHTRGWYLFPEHTDMIKLDWNEFWIRFRTCCVKTVFYDYYKYLYYLLLVAFAIIAGIKNKRYRYLSVIVPCFIIYCFVDEGRVNMFSFLTSTRFFVVFVLSIIIWLITYNTNKLFDLAYQRRFFVLGILFILGFFAFSAINFFTPRYLICTSVIMLFILAALLDTLAAQSYKWLHYVVWVTVPLFAFISFRSSDSYGDTQIGAFNAMDVQQAEVDYFEKNVPYDTPITTRFYLAQQHLYNPATGFLRHDKFYSKITWEVDDNTQYVLFDNIELSEKHYNQTKQDTNFHLIYRFQKGMTWTEVYKRK